MEVQQVKIEKLKNADYNPPTRTNRHHLSPLVKSIEEIGLQYPVLVTPDHHVIDGHRRLAACKVLGWTEVPVLISRTPQDRAYGDVNGTARRIGGNGALHIFLQNPSAVSQPMRSLFEQAEEQLGRDMLKRLCKNGNSIHVYRIAKEVATYCDQNTPKFLRSVVLWTLQFGVGTIRDAIRHEAPVRVITTAIKTKKPFKVRTEV